jgi:hypothetical protein
MQNKTNSTCGQLTLDGSWQEVPLIEGNGRFIIHSDVDVIMSTLTTPVDAQAFKLPATVGLDWAKQVNTVQVKGTGGTVWWIS